MTTDTDTDTEVSSMLSLADMFGSDKQLERNGIEIAYEAVDTYFLVGRTGGANDRYSQILAAKTMPHRQLLKKANRGTPSPKVLNLLRRLQREAFIEGALFNWRSERFGEGKIPNPKNPSEPLEFNVDNVGWLFDLLPDLYDDLVEQAGESYNFRAEQIEAAAGN